MIYESDKSKTSLPILSRISGELSARKWAFFIAGVLFVASAATVTLFSQSPASTPGQGSSRGRVPMIGGPGSPTADGSRAVSDGGIKVPGYTGKVDAAEEKAGMSKMPNWREMATVFTLRPGPRPHTGGPMTRRAVTTP